MITLIRLMVKNYLKAKWECAFWMAFNSKANELIKNPEEIEKKLLPYIVDAIQKSVDMERIKNENAFLEK